MTFQVAVDFKKPKTALLSDLTVGSHFVTIPSLGAADPVVGLLLDKPHGDYPVLLTNTGQVSWLPASLPASEQVYLVGDVNLQTSLVV